MKEWIKGKWGKRLKAAAHLTSDPRGPIIRSRADEQGEAWAGVSQRSSLGEQVSAGQWTCDGPAEGGHEKWLVEWLSWGQWPLASVQEHNTPLPRVHPQKPPLCTICKTKDETTYPPSNEKLFKGNLLLQTRRSRPSWQVLASNFPRVWMTLKWLIIIHCLFHLCSSNMQLFIIFLCKSKMIHWFDRSINSIFIE